MGLPVILHDEMCPDMEPRCQDYDKLLHQFIYVRVYFTRIFIQIH